MIKLFSGFLLFSILAFFCAGCQNIETLSNPIVTRETREKTNSFLPEIWLPEPSISFDIQFSGDFVENSFQSDILDLDLFETSVEMIEQLHIRNIKVFCYFSVGSWENWREDANLFPPQIIGRNYTG
jgi:hypothetical protein